MASPAHPDIPSVLLARFEHAVKELTARTGPFPGELVDKDVRKWLYGEDEPLAWRNSSGAWEGEGEGWLREPCGKLIRQRDTLSFDVLDEEGSWVPEKMTLEKDGLYRWRESGGPGHWWGFVSETETHTYLACNYINPDGHRGFQVFVWPK